MQVSTGSDVSSAPFIEQSAIISGVTEAVAAILEDENVDPYVDVDLMETDRVHLRKTPDNVGIVDVVITSLKSAGRNLDVLSGPI